MLATILSTPIIPDTWAWAYTNHREFLESPLGYSAFIVTVYVLAALPWVAIDYFKLLDKQKVQKDIYFNFKDLFVALVQYAVTEVFVYLPLTVIADKFFDAKVEVIEQPPLLGTFLGQCIASLALIDCTIFLMHYLLHTKFLYKHVHSVHHQYRTPFSFSTQAHHPIEAIMMGIAVTAPVMSICSHVLTQWATLSFVMVHGVLVHSGYDFGLFKMAKGTLGFPAYHDSHHLLTTKNLGAYTTIWDRLFGTFVTPPIYNESLQEVSGAPAKLTKTPSRRHVSFFGKPRQDGLTKRAVRS